MHPIALSTQVLELFWRQLLFRALLVKEDSRLPIDLRSSRAGTTDRGDFPSNLELHGLRSLVGIGQETLALAAGHGTKLGRVVRAGFHQIIDAIGHIFVLLLTGKAQKDRRDAALLDGLLQKAALLLKLLDSRLQGLELCLLPQTSSASMFSVPLPAAGQALASIFQIVSFLVGNGIRTTFLAAADDVGIVVQRHVVLIRRVHLFDWLEQGV
mmetsp:Transcript_15671/g.45253  ORF Transcript_15671/g.45253 Transcript_15671/m.45253 type:complete len:212 (-) Transcript_15671:126-761(-)